MDDLKEIKKKYGEEMMHFCRINFSTILEYPGILLQILLDNFNPSRLLYKDIVENGAEFSFKNYIYHLFDNQFRQDQAEEDVEILETPAELLLKAGYNLYECKTEEDIQSFRNYYQPKEELCTFKGGRLNSNYVYFAVKKDVDKIVRENFSKPRRQDEYGTSVISIQFTRDDSHTLSIKNRYNHTVANSDSTFSNDLDNIIAGLTDSFAQHYGMVQKNGKNDFEIPGYVRANDGRYYKYNYEINNIYYCPDNIIIDNFEVKRYPKEKYLVMDCYILDLVNKKMFLYDKQYKDSFPEAFTNINKIKIVREGQSHIVTIQDTEGTENKIILDENYRIIEVELPNIEEIGDRFMCYNKPMRRFVAPKLKKIGSLCFDSNVGIEELELPNIEEIGEKFMYFNKVMMRFIAPKLKKIGSYCFHSNFGIEELELPNVEEIGDFFMYCNEVMVRFVAPKLKKIGSYCFHRNVGIEELELPNVEEIGDCFMHCNKPMRRFVASKLKKIGEWCFSSNQGMKELELPNIEEIGNNFMGFNKVMVRFVAPKLKKLGFNFLYLNRSMEIFEVPNAEGSDILENHPNRDALLSQYQEGKHL